MKKLQTIPNAMDALAAGNEAIARNAWEEARDRFHEATDRDPASPKAWEGLGQACWWLEDQAGTFEARERAYNLYRHADDRQSAARLAIWLAMDSLDFRGEGAVANGWLQRARRLLDGLDPTPELGMIHLLVGHMALMGDNDIPRARECAREGLAIAKATKSPDVEVLALALEGLARVSQGEIADGMRLLDEATTAALGGEVSDLNAIGSACCYLIHACERVHDYDRATQWCLRVRDFCRRWRFTSMFTICRTQYASVLIYRGDWAEAEAELHAATDELRTSRPAGIASGIVRLAELRRRQGRAEEAAVLFEQARRHRLTPLGLAEMALDRGDAAAAADLVSQYLRRIPPESRTERVPGIEILVRVEAMRGDRDRAAEAVAELQETARVVGTSPMRAMALHAEGILASACDADPERARRCFDDAAILFEEVQAPYEAGRARIDLARALASLGRTDAAAREARRAHADLERLGARRDAETAAGIVRALEGSDSGAVTTSAPSEPRPMRSVAPEASPPPSPDPALPLTSREIDVLRLIARGMGDKEIADRLFLSPHTVHRHVSNILTKLEVPSRAAAVALASRSGLM